MVQPRTENFGGGDRAGLSADLIREGICPEFNGGLPNEQGLS